MMNSMKAATRLTMFSVATLLLALGVAGCNTISGAGKDIKSTGKAIERSAEDAK